MNNAGIVRLDNWKKAFDVNVFGIMNVQLIFVPVTVHRENPTSRTLRRRSAQRVHGRRPPKRLPNSLSTRCAACRTRRVPCISSAGLEHVGMTGSGCRRWCCTCSARAVGRAPRAVGCNDLTEGRSWHCEYKPLFEEYIREDPASL
ncbi:hypothetical protein DFH11DRAFT_1632508 [Phellopilus nigrolimitatus]|nr:hypothetical protein DFH11DRAFT_1632508 [Phellopilus nigrolimitatus]